MPQQDIGERYYYADGRKIPLVPSRAFVAVKAESTDSARAAESRVASLLSTIHAPTQVFDLPEHGLKVVRLPDGEDASSPTRGAQAARVRELMSEQPGMQLGPEVYETTDHPHGEALIAVNEILVKFKASASDTARRDLLASHGLEMKRDNYPEPHAQLVVARADADPLEIANALHESGLVEYAQPNFAILTPRLDTASPRRRTSSSAASAAAAAPSMALPATAGPMLAHGTVPASGLPASGLSGPAVGLQAPALAEPMAPPTDPAFSSQWGLKVIKAPEAFDISMGSPSISIAVIDEGCDLTHEDLSYRTPGYDAYDGDDDPTPQSSDAHGTACAGVAAARANNGKGGSGVAPNCRVLPVRIARGIGGGFWDTTPAKVADGVRKAVDRGADVLSNSYGLSPSTPITNAFKYAQTNGRGGKGCPMAAATGNGDVRGVIYPANLSPTIPGFLAIGATNEWDQRKSHTSLDGENWWGSNYGPEVDATAPGVHVYTSDIMGPAGYSGGNYIPNFNGTSSATPHAAGLMALILSVDPDLRSWEVEDIVKLTADDLGPVGRDEEFGFGRINCRRALEAASRVWYQIAIGVEFLGVGRECYMRANVRMYNPGINTVRLDALTLTSHTPTWTAEIDRFELRPNPGSLMTARSGQDIRLNRMLLRANGNQSSWSYRWALNWTYTYWRPSAAAFPLSSQPGLSSQEGLTLNDSEGRTVTSQTIQGGDSGEGAQPSPDTGLMAGLGRDAPHAPFGSSTPSGYATSMMLPGGLPGGSLAQDISGHDVISVDRATRSVMILVR